MIPDDHQRTRLIGAVYSACRIGEKDFFHSQTFHNTDRQRDQSLAVSFVIVYSSLHGDYLLSHTGSHYKLSCMACHCRYGEVRDIMVGNSYRILDLVCVISQPAAQDHPDLRLKICLFTDDADGIFNYFHFSLICHGCCTSFLFVL